MADTEKTVLINVKLAAQEAQTNMGNLESAINDLSAATTALKTVTENTQKASKSYTDEIAQSKVNIQRMREETARLSEEKKREKIAVDNAKQAVVAAKGSYNETQASVKKLTQEVKSMGNAMGQSNPQVKAAQAEIKRLNSQLKAFDAQMGNHQRNVGNYTQALSGFSQALNSLIPGFSQFSSILTGATRGFNAMKGSATEAGGAAVDAEGAVVGAGASALAAIAAIVAAIVVEGTYLLQFQKYADGVSKSWQGIKASAVAAMGYLNGDVDHTVKSTGNAFMDMGMKMAVAYTQANVAQGKMIDLGRAAKNAATLTQSEDMQVQLLIKDIRDRTTSATQAQQDYNKVLKINGDQYKRNHEIAVQTYTSQIDLLAAGYPALGKEIGALKDLSKGYQDVTDKAKDLVYQQKLGADFLDKFNEGLQGIIATDNKKAQSDEMAKIRDDMKQSRAETSREKELAELAKIKQETEQANSERVASITKTLDFKRQAFAKELSDSDEHYRQLIFKQRKFIEDMQLIVNSPKSTAKEKTAAKGGIAAGNGLIGQLSAEQTANQQKLLEDHSKAILAETQKAANDLAQLQISGLKNIEERERQAEELSYKEKLEAHVREQKEFKENKDKLTNDIKTATAERAAILKKELADTQTLIDTANDKMVETKQQHQQRLLDIAQKAQYEREALVDQTNILKQKGKNANGTNNKGVLQAEQTELLNQYARDVSDKSLTDEKKLELEQKYLNDKDALNKAYSQKQKEYDLQMAQQVENAAFSIIQQSMERSNQANEINMQRQKGYDLSNQALTATQKYEINEKYRILEGQAKVKQFHQEQELALAKGAIDTAAAILKASPDVPLMVLAGVTGALELAVIATQKAPAYATGGLHYQSDGTGALLRGPGNGTSDSMNARLSNGESVINAQSTSWFAPLLSAINVAGGGKSFSTTKTTNPWSTAAFASGGVFNNYLPTGDNGLRPNMSTSNNRLHPDDIASIAGAVSNIKFPAIITDIKDINNQNQILSNVQDRRTY